MNNGVPIMDDKMQRTNADRIRAMTDEELAVWMCDRSCSLCPLKDCKGRMEVGRTVCYNRWLD